MCIAVLMQFNVVSVIMKNINHKCIYLFKADIHNLFYLNFSLHLSIVSLFRLEALLSLNLLLV